ncbi:hypothetical protein CHCC20335_3380 [Bacillus paralicheniformis]|nr:hypothetical protein CHCC20335_3380 [Bacillus paralicheniformis]
MSGKSALSFFFCNEQTFQQDSRRLRELEKQLQWMPIGQVGRCFFLKRVLP